MSSLKRPEDKSHCVKNTLRTVDVPYRCAILREALTLRKGYHMRLEYNSRYRPETPLGDGEMNRDNCECVCEYDHCQDCSDCERRNSGQCDACDSGECGHSECDCDNYCSCEAPEEGGLHDHSTDVLNVFNACVINDDICETPGTGTILLGAEVELEIPDGETEEAHAGFCKAFDIAPLFIGKDDGSLNNGMEMVTLPLTLSEHEGLANALEAHWFPVMEKSSRTGMHVHIDKATFEDSAHMEAFADFFSGHNGHADWNLFLNHLLRRASNNYCERLSGGKALRQNGKYSAVNFSKQYTLEVRGFHSVRSAKTYIANLELVLAVRDATADKESKATATPRNFMEYVNENAEKYPHLAARLRLTHNDAGNELFAPWLGETRDEEMAEVQEQLLENRVIITHATETEEFFGPNHNRVRAFIENIRQATVAPDTQYAARDAAWNAAWNTAWNAARDAARGAAWNAAWDAARDAVRDAARDAAQGAARCAIALVVEDLITSDQFSLLTTGFENFIPASVERLEQMICV